jgi:glycerol-3-phosphate acyltransferase PlsY
MNLIFSAVLIGLVFQTNSAEVIGNNNITVTQNLRHHNRATTTTTTILNDQLKTLFREKSNSKTEIYPNGFVLSKIL